MSSTSSRERVRSITAFGRTLRTSVRPGTDPGVPPLLLMNGIGASLELFAPLVAQLDPRREVVRFDVPGIGGSQGSTIPLPMAALSTLLADLLDQLDGAQVYLSRESVEALRAAGVAPVSTPLTERPSVYPNSQLQGLPIALYDPKNPAVAEVQAVTRELLEVLGEVPHAQARP